MSHECYMNVTFRFCFRSPLKSLKLPVFKGLSTDLGSHSFLHISFYPLYFATPFCENIRKVSGRFSFFFFFSFSLVKPTSSATTKASVFPLILPVILAPISFSFSFKEALSLSLPPEITHVLFLEILLIARNVQIINTN